MGEKPVSDNQIKLSGSDKYHTTKPGTLYHVEKGQVYVYVVSATTLAAGRSILLTEVSEGANIPTFFKVDKETVEGWMFRFIPKDEAVLTAYRMGEHQDKYQNDFLEKYTDIHPSDNGFNNLLLEWYNNQIFNDTQIIEGIEREKIRAEKENRNLIGSLFEKKRLINTNVSTESVLYNSMSVLCDYMNIKICSYGSLVQSRGKDFTPQDIARASHFVIRKITLGRKWYKENGGAFLAYTKDGNEPVLCIPKGIGSYILYNLEKKTEVLVEEEEANQISDEVYIIYQHLPLESIGVKDVLKYGIRRINTKDIVFFLLMYLIVTFIGLLLPLLNKQLFDKLIPIGQEKAIYQIGMVIFTCMIGNIFFGLVQNLASFRAIKSMEYSIVAATYDRVFRLPQKFINSFGSTEIINRVSSISGVFSQTLTAGVTAVVGFILSLFYLGRMFEESKKLAWRGIILAILTGIVMYLFGKLRITKEREQLEASAKANGKLYNYISGILKIKVSGIENRCLYEFQKSNVEALKYSIRSTTISNAGAVFTSFMSVFYTGFMFYTIIKKHEGLTIGSFTAFNSAYGFFNSAVLQLVTFFLSLAALIPVMDRVKPIFEEKPDYSDDLGAVERLKGKIEITHLDFAYEDDENLTLKDICLNIQPGEFVGIVGPSGCGKSTLLKCLLGFENPTKGNIFYDNRDIISMDKVELRRQMGVVLQDGQMVVGNIYTNVTLSNPEMSAGDALELLRIVDLYDDVQKMPMGIFTSISEGGGTVSGGQQQRILLARAIANNPAILILDEATSALDNVTQARVCENLKSGNMTRIMIAHRLSTVINCDKIVVMDEGRIVEVGNYQELMDKKGLFYELAKRQQVNV